MISKEPPVQLTSEMLHAGVHVLQQWYDGSGDFEEGVRQIWLEMSLVQKGEKVSADCNSQINIINGDRGHSDPVGEWNPGLAILYKSLFESMKR